MAALADSPHEAAKYVGLYKTLEATGGAVAWAHQRSEDKAITQLTINWALLGASLVVVIPAVLAITPSPTFDDISNEEEDEKVGI